MHGSFAFILFIVFPVLCLVFVWRMLGDNRRRQDSDEYTDETRMMQEMYRSLSRMEERLDSLETLLAQDKGESHEKR